KELFKSPTIKELSKYIESAEENLYSKIEKVEEKDTTKYLQPKRECTCSNNLIRIAQLIICQQFLN
ncbi:hypothetical protein JQ031_12605, partial [Clostridium botulinum]|nr:hypothetical protein [Clostridium botulinum]